MMEKWEYKRVYISGATDLEPELNKLGADGWELLFCEEHFYYFKRRLL